MQQLRSQVRRLRLRSQTVGLTRVQRRNFLYTQLDAVGVGLVMSVSPFVSVFLTRLGATNRQVGLLSAVPGIAGLFLGLVMGGVLQRRRRIVPIYALARFLRLIIYAGVGLSSLLFPPEAAIYAILAVMLVTNIPQSLITVAFSILMNQVSGPNHRFALLSRRWATIAVVGVVMTLVVGQLLDRVPFPLNYEITFIGLAVAGSITSYLFAGRISVPDAVPPDRETVDRPVMVRLRETARLLWAEKAYVSIVSKRLVYIMGSHLVMPLFTLYYVRELGATDAQISLITTSQRLASVAGFYLWPRVRKQRGTRVVMVITTLAMSLYPMLTAATNRVGTMILLAGVASVFQSGIRLAFFDRLMASVPEEGGAIFVAVSQTLQHVESIVGPLISTWLADFIGLGGALVLGACFRFAGFVLFALDRGGARREGAPVG